MNEPRVDKVIGAPEAPNDPGLIGASGAGDRITGSVQLLEEELSVTTRQVLAGTLRVSTRTLTHDEVAETTLKRDVLDVSRVPVGRFVDVAPLVRTEGDTTIVPVLEERLVMVKQLYLKEELHIRHSVERETVQQTVPLRSQEAVIERVDSAGRTTPQEVESRQPR